MAPKILTLTFMIVTLAKLLFGQAQTGPKHGKVVMCSFSSWSKNLEEPAKFDIEDIDPSFCTHLIYSFANLDENTNKITGSDADFQRLASLKGKTPHLKIIVSLGAWGDGSQKYSKMAATRNSRAQFVNSVLAFIKRYSFDGICVHWNKLRTTPEDKRNYVALMKELKEAFTPNGYILNTSVPGHKFILDSAYDLPNINKYVDFIHLLAIDYHSSRDRTVGANAPLVGLNEDDSYSVDYAIKYMFSHGVSPNKLILSLSLNGLTFILEEPAIENIEFGRSRTQSEGFSGPITNQRGSMNYNEICQELTKNSGEWTQHWNDQGAVPYARNKERVITYENARSIAVKVKKTVDYGLAGVMVWAISSDDFNGLCDTEPEYVSVSFSDLRRVAQIFNQMVKNPALKRLLKDVNITDAKKLETLSSKAGDTYKNHLWSTDSNPKYPLLRAIDKSIALAVEEKMIMTDMMDVMKGDRHWMSPSSVTTNSPFKDVTKAFKLEDYNIMLNEYEKNIIREEIFYKCNSNNSN